MHHEVDTVDLLYVLSVYVYFFSIDVLHIEASERHMSSFRRQSIG